MIYLFVAPDVSEGAIKVALSRSACPPDAVVQVDAPTGLVRIETAGVWRADKNGREEALGVDGWTCIGSEITGAPVDAIEKAKVTIKESKPVDTKADVIIKGAR